MQKRVSFDFTVSFTNGGGLQGQDFRLDIPGDDISDEVLANAIVADLGLLMAGPVSISNKTIFTEPHKRTPSLSVSSGLVDLSHTITSGLVTYKGLPAPIVCDYLSREASRAIYAPGTEFQIGKIEMVTNTGTYLDCPFHRYADGTDLSQLDLAAVTDVPGTVIRVPYGETRTIDAEQLRGHEFRGRAVLIHTGWDAHWNTEQYFTDHPALTADAALYLKDCGATLVGIDSHNIDATSTNERPVHSTLLGANILIVEHLCGLEQLPDQGFTFTAVPPKWSGVGTFPVRAFAKWK